LFARRDKYVTEELRSEKLIYTNITYISFTNPDVRIVK